MDIATPAIEAKDLGRRFGRLHAVRNINLRVSKGEILGLVGSDGSGKTTLLQLLAGILDPSEGQCRVLGFDTVKQSREVTSRIGYMAQGFTLYDRLTVSENLVFAAKVRGVSAAELVDRRQRLLSMAGLSRFPHRREGALSGGMRKKLALCTNLIHHPPLLLLDEPGLGVDPLSRRELWRMLEAFRRQGITIVFSTSYMDEAERGDRVALLDRGRILAMGTPQDLRSRAAGAAFRMPLDRRAEAEPILRRSPGTLGIQREMRELRLTVLPEADLIRDLKAELGKLAPLESAPPSMEDAFLVLRARADGGTRGPAPEVRHVEVAHPAAQEASIQTVGLTRRFGSFVAVDGVSLDVRPGEIFGLLGANGAGKTTLIRMLCGLLPPSDGRAYVAGTDIASEAQHLRSRIGYMSQRFSLYSDLTAAENMVFFASAYGLSRRARREAIDWAQAMAGLEGVGKRPAGRLSGAVRQRLALACSMMHRPAVLFLDEPTSGVDPESRFYFWRLIDSLAEAGTTVLVTTHYMTEAAYCHRLALMHEGRLIAAGDIASLRENLGTTAPETIEEVFLAYIERESERAAQSAGVAS